MNILAKALQIEPSLILKGEFALPYNAPSASMGF